MRVSTFGNYQSALLDLMGSQLRSQEAQQRVSTQKNATDLVGFGRSSESLTALKSAQSRIGGFIDAGKAAAGRLTSQNLALGRVADGAAGAREAIAGALASGRLDGLMLELQGQFQVSLDGLNTKHQGRYLFAGGASSEAPVTPRTLAELSALVDPDEAFVNDGLVQVSRLDEGTTLETGFLADDLGADLFRIFHEIQRRHETTPVTGALDDATRDFLTARLSRLDDAREAITDRGARNGSIQNRVDDVLKAQQDQRDALEALVSERTDADLAKALTDLELSQVAMQASAQVINQLRQVSLLNLLR
ncbi:flagellin [Brevundimonas sp.]|jgi:flagellar hook-associated protein 3 FlgL|uniref:flagellin n=1 Tax=Brevundimonas sp. TaxID=1871086 RepID=UPI002E0E25C7|nr:flagellin [Brevundimonas sp.]